MPRRRGVRRRRYGSFVDQAATKAAPVAVLCLAAVASALGASVDGPARSDELPAVPHTGLTGPSVSPAGENASIAEARVRALQDRARAMGLADERAWRRLLHYHDGPAGFGPPRSHVDDARFFLAGPVGRDSPAAELDATIAALFGAGGAGATNAENDPRCRFVARERWLRARLGDRSGAVVAPLPSRPPCEAYVAWRERVRAHSVTLVFPAAYLNNPSSMFGHTLLRLDPPDVESGSTWLSWALNFAADVGDDTPRSATYAWKGITGGYPGRFQLEPYFTKLRQYGAIENRDIHEYRLGLTPMEVTRLVEHVWELRDIAFDYYFFRENCSFRLLELLDHARLSLDLAADFPLTAIPADTVKAVVRTGLVDASTWLPSTASWLAHESALVPRAARDRIDTLARDPKRVDAADFAALEPHVQHAVVRAANRLLTYRARREPPSPAAADRRLAMLTLLAGFPPAPLAPPPAPGAPERGHDTALATIGVGREAGREHIELGLRASYHDLLDRPLGYMPGAAIELGELRLRAADEDGLRVERFEAVSIRSVGVSIPNLPAIGWGIDAGLVRDADVEGGRLGLRVRGLAGVSGSPVAGLLLHMLAGPSLRVLARADEAPGRARVDATFRIGALRHGLAGGTLVELGVDALQGRAPRVALELAHNVPLSRNHALRARLAASRIDGGELRSVALDYRVHFR